MLVQVRVDQTTVFLNGNDLAVWHKFYEVRREGGVTWGMGESLVSLALLLFRILNF